MSNLRKEIARQDANFRIMRLIEAKPDCGQREIARRLGVSLGAVNYCLRALIQIGFVKAKNFRSAANKKQYVYLLTPDGARKKSILARSFLERKLREYEALKAEIETLGLEVEDRAPNSESAALDHRNT